MNNPTDRPKIPHKASKSYLIFDSPTIYILVTKHDGIPLLSCEWDQHTVSFARAGETVRLELNPEINIPNERSPGYINDFFYTGNWKYVRLDWQYFIVVDKMHMWMYASDCTYIRVFDGKRQLSSSPSGTTDLPQNSIKINVE